jgi:hypothetical protein
MIFVVAVAVVVVVVVVVVVAVVVVSFLFSGVFVFDYIICVSIICVLCFSSIIAWTESRKNTSGTE